MAAPGMFRTVVYVLGMIVVCGAHADVHNKIEALLDDMESMLLYQQDEARSLAVQIERLIETEKQDEYRPRLLNLQAHIDILTNDYQAAYQKADKAEKLAHAEKNALQEAEAIRRKGIISFLLQSDAEALDLFTKSLKMHRELGSKYVMNNLQSIGNLFHRDARWADNLIEIGYELIAVAERWKNPSYIEQGFSFVAAGLIEKTEFQAALRVLNKARETLESDTESVNYYLSLVEFHLGNHRRAIEYIDAHLDKNEQATVFHRISGYAHKAKVLLAQGERAEGLKLLQEALSLSRDIDYNHYEQNATLKLATYFEEEGDYQQASHYRAQYAQLVKEAFSKTQSQHLAFSRARLEMEQKNQRIAELRLSKQLVEQDSVYKSFVIVLCLSLLALMVFYSLIVARQKRALYRYSSELQEAKESLETSNVQLRQMASTDELTGIANRRVCHEFIRQEWNSLMRTSKPISILLIDVDHFKIFNDTYGHKAGDECLKKLAQALAKAVHRPKDMVARYGGEEFICVLADTSSDGALKVAEDIQTHVQKLAIAHRDSPTYPFVTLSIGVATEVPKKDHAAHDLIALADNCLYQAKHDGRNCIRSTAVK